MNTTDFILTSRKIPSHAVMKKVFPLWVKTPRLAMQFMPEAVWRVPAQTKTIYLTFDDGPVPEATPFVLEQLRKHQAKATFFCVGENIEKHPDLFMHILGGGHAFGNHTMHHLSGWAATTNAYLKDVDECNEIMNRFLKADGKRLFRPPYGRIRPRQYQQVKKNHRVVMWDVLSYDFDKNLSGEQVFKNVVRHAAPGSVVVLHDSAKAFPRLQTALPKILQHFAGEGWKFECV